MSNRTSRDDRGDSNLPEWMKDESESQPIKEEDEEVVPHTPSRNKELGWAYTTKEGGDISKLNFPKTEKKIKEVEAQLRNPRNWRRYKRHPQGGHRNYTQVTCFPPFDFLRLAELYLPDGRVWKSRTRQFHEQDN